VTKYCRERSEIRIDELVMEYCEFLKKGSQRKRLEELATSEVDHSLPLTPMEKVP